MHHSYGGDTNCEVRNFFQYVGALSQADAQTWVNAIAAAWVARMMAILSSTLTLTSTELTDLTSASSAQAISGTSGVGADGNPSLSASAAMVIRLKIARRYRGGHPRLYLPGLPQGNLQTDQTWTAAGMTQKLNAFNLFISDSLTAVPVAAAPATEVSVSYFSGFTAVTNPVTHRARNVPNVRTPPLIDAVLSHSINPHVGSQRRRNQQ